MADEDPEFSLHTIKKWIGKNWVAIRKLVESHEDLNLEGSPEMYYNAAPATRGRRARRAMGPKYQEAPEFRADKELFEAELRGDVGPLNEEPNEESAS
jgi:hypothetical protein